MIKTDHTTNNVVSLHQGIKEKLFEENLRQVKICIGSLEKDVILAKHEDEDSIIYLSKDLITNYMIPEFIEYEIKVKGDVLHIGPTIGLLVRGKLDEMNAGRIKIYKNYLIDYKNVNGLVLLFTSDGIDRKNRRITGFVYNPQKHMWIKGVYPFPSTVFVRKTLGESDRKYLQSMIGNNFFNSDVFNKWEMWKWFSKEQHLKKYFAETVIAQELEQVKQLLNKYGKIYIKPISGMQGTKIYQVVHTSNEYQLNYRLNGKNVTTVFDDWLSMKSYLDTSLKLEKFIAQQAIPLLKNKQQKRVMDFRVIAVKDENGEWNVPGMVTRFGEEDSIVSNISSGGSAEKVWNSLLLICNKDTKKAFQKYKELEGVAIQCCKKLEDRGLHLGYLGIDMGIDDHHNLWIIEINNRSPDMTIALDANDSQLYYKVKVAPLHYAKWLAGFGGDIYETY
jgi:glutathione synthase/RimK-type ligase-like ATP-grasp enzyme